MSGLKPIQKLLERGLRRLNVRFEQAIIVAVGQTVTEEREKIVQALGKDSPYSQLRREELRLNWRHLLGLPVWIVAVALLSYQGIVASTKQKGTLWFSSTK